ncbi:MAG: hypothetical protein ACYC64_19365, partial [Armatimonadota bacterium]
MNTLCSRSGQFKYHTGLGAILAILLVLAAVPGFATTYYVSLSGNDNNTGLSPSEAWASINNGDARSILLPGDLVLVSAGTYPQSSANGV